MASNHNLETVTMIAIAVEALYTLSAPAAHVPGNRLLA